MAIIVNFKDRIVDLVGSIPATITDDGESIFKAGIADVINRVRMINQQALYLFATSGSITDNTGYTLTNGDLLDVSRNGAECSYIPANLRFKSADVGSIHYCTTRFPVYYLLGGKVYIVPVPTVELAGTVYVVAVGAITNYASGTSSIATFPTDFYHLPILYTAKQIIMHKLSVHTTPSNIILPVVPTSPTIEVITSSLPTFTAPGLLVYPTPPSDTDISFTDTDKPTFDMPDGIVLPVLDLSGITLSITAISLPTTPTAPSVPVFSTEDTTATGIVSQTISSFGTVPSYTQPVLSLTDAPTISDLSISASAPTAPTNASATVILGGTAPTYTKPTFSAPTLGTPGSLDLPAEPVMELQVSQAVSFSTTAPTYTKPTVVMPTAPTVDSFSLSATAPTAPEVPVIDNVDITAVTVASFGTAPSYTEPSLVLPVPPTISTVDISADLEQAMSGVVTAIPTIAVNTVSETGSVPIYVSPTTISQVAFTDYSSGLSQSAPGALSISTVVPVPPESPSIDSTAISAVTVGAFSTAPVYTPPVMETPNYTDANTWITAEDAEMAGTRIGVIQTKVAEYQADIQNSIQEFNDANVEYQSDILQEIEDARIAAQKAQQDAQLDLQAQIQDYQSKLTRYAYEVQSYQAQVTQEIQEYQSNLSSYSAELPITYQAWQKTETDKITLYGAELQNALNSFNAKVIDYQAQVQIDIKNLDSDNQYDANQLRLWQDRITAYQSEVNELVQQTQINNTKDLQLYNSQTQAVLGEYGARLQNALNVFNDANVEYQATIQAYIENARIAAAKAQQDSQLDLQAQIQEYQSTLALYSNEIQSYQSQVNAEVQDYVNEIQLNLQKYQTSVQAALGEYQANIQNELNEFNKENTEYQAQLQLSLKNADIDNDEQARKVQEYLAQIQSYQIEVNATIQKWVQEEWIQTFEEYRTDYASLLQEYVSDIQNELNEFNKENVEYQANVQASMQDAVFDNEEDKNNLTKYMAEIQSYQAEVNAEVQEYVTNEINLELKKWADEQALKLQLFSLNIQNALNTFQKENAEYQGAIQKNIRQAELDVQRLTAVAQQADTVALQNKAQELTASIEEYRSTLQKYVAELTQYQVETNATVAEWQGTEVNGTIQEFETKRTNAIAQHQVDTSSILQKFAHDMQKEMQRYTGELQKWFKVVDRAVVKYQAETGFDVSVYSQNITSVTHEYRAKLDAAIKDFEEEVSKFGLDVQNITSKNQSNLTKYQAELSAYSGNAAALIQNFSANLQADQVEYEWLIRQYEYLSREYSEGFLPFNTNKENKNG